MEFMHYAAVSSERTRLEPPTPLLPKKSSRHSHGGLAATPLGKGTPGKSTPRTDSKRARASMPGAMPSHTQTQAQGLLGLAGIGMNPPDPSGTPTPATKKRRKSHGHDSARKHKHKENINNSHSHRASSPAEPATSPIANYTPLGKLSALAATALALANANPSEQDAMISEEEARRVEKERRREEKRRRREARAAEAAAEAAAEEDAEGGEDADEGRKKKRKHKDKESAGSAVTYSLPAPATPARAALPLTPTPKRRKHRENGPSQLKPETPYTGPSRSAADVSMTALLASGRKRRPGPEDEAAVTGSARKHSRRESRTGADMAVSALLVTPRPHDKKSKKDKKDKKDKKRTVENTMGVHALLATPGAPLTPGMDPMGLPPSTPGYSDIPDTDGIEPVDEDRRAEKERRRAERRAEKARRKAEKAEKKARKEQERAQREVEVPRVVVEHADNARQNGTWFVGQQPVLPADSDLDDDGVNPADILRGIRPAAPAPPPALAPAAPAEDETDLTAILRGRPRQSAPAPKKADPPAKPKTKALKKVLPAPTTISGANAAAAFATTTRNGRKKNGSEGPSQEEQDTALRRELADEAVMNEFLASKWIEIKELQRLEAAGVLRYKRGRFSEEERSALREWLDTFRRVNKLSEEELLDIIMAKGKAGERSQYPKFYSDLAGQVPGRPVRYVKEAVKRMYDPRARKGAWTKAEDAELLRAYELHPNEWIKIAAIVDRSESDCRDRWRGELKGQESRVTGAWSAEETDALIAAVTEANKRLGLPPTAPETPWQVVVDLMGGTRSLTQCRKKWQDTILPDLKAQEARDAGVHITKTSVSRRDLLDRLRALNVTHERDLSWTRVVPPEWDVKPGTLRGVWHRMKHAVNGWNEMPFTELLDKIEESL